MDTQLPRKNLLITIACSRTRQSRAADARRYVARTIPTIEMAYYFHTDGPLKLRLTDRKVESKARHF